VPVSEGTKPAVLKLVERSISGTGVMIGKYVRAGDVNSVRTSRAISS
jgi:hypothetical protein